jgi:transcriptional regulator with XRE-family HTH domain
MESVSLRRGDDRQQVLLGEAVRAARKAQGLTQKQVAERTGVHVTYISDIERGARNPTVLVLGKLAEALQVEPSELLKRG